MAIGSKQWLGLVTEEIIDPQRPICDAHHHLWDSPESRYLLDELLLDTGSGHNVVSTVFVECTSMYRQDGEDALRPVGETEFVNGVAAMSASGGYGDTRACVGIVSYANLALGAEAGAVLDAHMAVSPRFKGIRHAAGWDASPAIKSSHTNPPAGLYLDTTFRQGFAELEKRGLSFDALLYHPQISEVTDLAQAFPDTTIILDHFGRPLGIGPYAGQSKAVFKQWRQQIEPLSHCANVVVKVGGLVMPVNGFDFHKRERPPTSDEIVAATDDYYRVTIDLFGPDRCMFESNFPVEKQSTSYGVLWNAFKKLASGYSETEKSALFHDTASRVYRLSPTH